MTKEEFKKADLEPVKKLIKEKASQGKFENDDIKAIIDETKQIYKVAPLTEIDILRIYNTMIDEMGVGLDKTYKTPILLKIFGIVSSISWIVLIPAIISGFSNVINWLENSSNILTYTTITVVITNMIVSVAIVGLLIAAGILMFLGKRVISGRVLYISIALTMLLLVIVTSLDGVNINFMYVSILAVIEIIVSVYLHPKLYQERRFYRMLIDLDTEQRAKEDRLGMSVDPNKGYIELDFFNLFWIFIIGCIIGLLAEYVFHVFFVWGFDTSQWYDRAGLLVGPFSPIYGFGCLFMTLALNRLRNMNSLGLFLMCTLIGGVFEYAVSWFLEVAFGIEAWNYTGQFLNINGRTCLAFASMFGIMGFAWIRWALPMFMKLINRIPWKLRYPITFIAAIFMIINCVMTLQSIDCWSQRQSGKVPVTHIEKFYEKNFNNDFMQKRFASMNFQEGKSARENINSSND